MLLIISLFYLFLNVGLSSHNATVHPTTPTAPKSSNLTLDNVVGAISINHPQNESGFISWHESGEGLPITQRLVFNFFKINFN